MSIDKTQLARAATLKALRVRRAADIALSEPVCVYDLAERLGIEVRFADIPSMEGVYCVTPTPTAIVSSLRPPGRQAFTCAHEVGHHVCGHGEQFDEIVEQRAKSRRVDPREFQADCFAGILLMPKAAVARGFSVRGWNPLTCDPTSVYVVATWLGVGYATLIHHMRATLGTMSRTHGESLLRSSLPDIRARLLGRACPEHLIVADENWTGRAIDAQVSDLILLPTGAKTEGNCAEIVREDEAGAVAVAVASGMGRISVEASGWSAYVRVARHGFVGRGRYRFEEDAGDD